MPGGKRENSENKEVQTPSSETRGELRGEEGDEYKSLNVVKAGGFKFRLCASKTEISPIVFLMIKPRKQFPSDTSPSLVPLVGILFRSA